MLQHITWQTFFTVTGTALVLYYGFVAIKWFPIEIEKWFNPRNASGADLQTAVYPESPAADYSVIGASGGSTVIPGYGDDLIFGPSDIPDESEPGIEDQEDTALVTAFSDMVSEIKTLIRVIADSNDSRENFEMLFLLEVQKFSCIAYTPYQEKINHYLLKESSGVFPFQLTPAELNGFWNSLTSN